MYFGISSEVTLFTETVTTLVWSALNTATWGTPRTLYNFFFFFNIADHKGFQLYTTSDATSIYLYAEKHYEFIVKNCRPWRVASRYLAAGKHTLNHKVKSRDFRPTAIDLSLPFASSFGVVCYILLLFFEAKICFPLRLFRPMSLKRSIAKL